MGTTVSKVTMRPGRIDVQFHSSPAFSTERVNADGGHITTNRWSTEAALEYMDTYGVAGVLMSVSTPGVDFLVPVEGVAMARAVSDAAAEINRENPGRFGNFATLPM